MSPSIRTQRTSTAPRAERTTSPPKAGALLAGGALAGLVFALATITQALTREGFDARRHPLSMLSLGELGWLQTGVFVLTGVLVVGSAVGLARSLEPGPGDTWGPRLIAVYGGALIWAGVFPTDPADGYPVGTPAGAPDAVSWHGMLHNLAPLGMGLALGAACLVMARRFARRGERGWALYSVLAPVAYLLLGFASFPAADFRLMLAGGAVIWTWASAICLKTLRDTRPPR